jgi:hypothetical protein
MNVERVELNTLTAHLQLTPTYYFFSLYFQSQLDPSRKGEFARICTCTDILSFGSSFIQRS